MQYARSAALKCFVNKVDPDQAARKSCLVMVHSVCLRRYDIDHTQVDMKQVEFVLYARAAALKLFL